MLENVNVGDRVKSCLAGWGTVEKIQKDPPYPIRIHFDSKSGDLFTLDGKRHRTHLYPEIVEVAKREWEPEGGEFVIEGIGSVAGGRTAIPSELYRLEGRAYPTEELANKAYAMIRPFQRIVAYVLEHAPDYEPDWENPEEEKWYVWYNTARKKYRYSFDRIEQDLCRVYMPLEVAKSLAEKLNSGEVKL